MVRLGPVAEWILTRHNYPTPVAALLGEAVAMAVVLAGALDYEGVFSLHVKGDEPVNLIAVDVTSSGEFRSIAAFDSDSVGGVAGGLAPVPRLLGQDFMAFTVDQGRHTETYQGIVELAGATLADCAHTYFRQSEQIECVILLAAGQPGEDGPAVPWRAGAMMIQNMPESDGRGGDDDSIDEDWRRGAILMGSLTVSELLDPALRPEPILYRLFHEQSVRAFSARALRPQCRCTRNRVESMLRSFSRHDLDDMKVDGKVVVTCEFCNSTLAFSDADLDRIKGF